MRSALLYIYNYFGENRQRDKIAGICQEYINVRSDESIAELFIMTSQFVLAEPEIKEIVDKKTADILRKIENNLYKKP